MKKINIQIYAEKKYKYYKTADKLTQQRLIQECYKDLYDYITPFMERSGITYIAEQYYISKGNKLISNDEVNQLMDDLGKLEEEFGSLQVELYRELQDVILEYKYDDEKAFELTNEHYKQYLKDYPGIYHDVLKFINDIYNKLYNFVSVEQLKDLKIEEKYIKYWDLNYLTQRYLDNMDFTILNTNWIYNIQDLMEEKLKKIKVNIYLKAAVHDNPIEFLKKQKTAYELLNKLS